MTALEYKQSLIKGRLKRKKEIEKLRSKGMTLAQIGAKMGGISRQRVFQIVTQ